MLLKALAIRAGKIFQSCTLMSISLGLSHTVWRLQTKKYLCAIWQFSNRILSPLKEILPLSLHLSLFSSALLCLFQLFRLKFFYSVSAPSLYQSIFFFFDSLHTGWHDTRGVTIVTKIWVVVMWESKMTGAWICNVSLMSFGIKLNRWDLDCHSLLHWLCITNSCKAKHSENTGYHAYMYGYYVCLDPCIYLKSFCRFFSFTVITQYLLVIVNLELWGQESWGK